MKHKIATWTLWAVACGGWAFGGTAGSASTLRFDMGPEQSVLAPGFIRIDALSRYSPGRGYGWEETDGLKAFDVEKPPLNPGWSGPGGQVIPKDLIIYKEHTPLTRDGVRCSEDLLFRVDLPDGPYRVKLTLGNLAQPIHSLQIFLNGDLVASDVDAKHMVRRGGADHYYGFPRVVRHTVQVAAGVLRLRIHGDDSGFRRRFLEEFEKDGTASYLSPGRSLRRSKPPRPDISMWGSIGPRGRPGGSVWVWEEIGGPFSENSLMALEVYPFRKPPLWREAERLVSNRQDDHLLAGVESFNRGDFARAEKQFQVVTDDYSRALGFLWLAGHPDYEEEQRLVPLALGILEEIAGDHADDLMFAEILENARRMDRAIDRFVHRADEQRSYNELEMISGEVASMQEEDPTYFKGLIYAGRGLYMVIPHRWTYAAGAGRQRFEKLREAGFGDNRFVRWYLDDEWEPQPPDWQFPDYGPEQEGVPGWAAAVYEAYNRELDLAEWWFNNRQMPDGSLGGGWGDDVEILRGFGMFGNICADASPLILEGTRRVADGAWYSGSVDTRGGYFAEVGDTEHTGEWTADTLVPMIRIDYGNPVYLERAMKTGRLMRDLWMDFNQEGHFWMRANFLGAVGVGSPLQQNESRINYRPALPARSVYWYNRLPALERLFLDWADSWLAASLSTERGKPRGIIPQEIGFQDSLIGGVQSESWFKATKARGTVNYHWRGAGGYHDYIVDLFLLAYEATGARKYLQPMELEAAFVERHLPASLRGAAPSEPRVSGGTLPPGSNEWIAAGLAAWPEQWEKTKRVLLPEETARQDSLWDLEEIKKQARLESDWARKRWPHVTTESMATDRVFWPGMGNAARIMTAYGLAGDEILVTYRGLGRQFAAAVLKASRSEIEVILFNLSSQDKEASLIPWVLQSGADYRVRVSRDEDLDGRPDRTVSERMIRLAHRGQEMDFRIPARAQLILRAEKSSAAAGAGNTPDLAVGPGDLAFLAEYRRVDVTVHNLGSAAVRGIDVILTDGTDREIGRQRIPHLAAPLDLDPKTVRVGFPFEPRAKRQQFRVLVRPAHDIAEITNRNNQFATELETPKEPKKQHSHP